MDTVVHLIMKYRIINYYRQKLTRIKASLYPSSGKLKQQLDVETWNFSIKLEAFNMLMLYRKA